MDCLTLFEHLTDFLDGALPPEQEREALEHLATCARCETVLAQTRAVSDLVSEHGKLPLGEASRQRLLGSILHDVEGSGP